jgi:hypothetical protein
MGVFSKHVSNTSLRHYELSFFKRGEALAHSGSVLSGVTQKQLATNMSEHVSPAGQFYLHDVTLVIISLAWASRN